MWNLAFQDAGFHFPWTAGLRYRVHHVLATLVENYAVNCCYSVLNANTFDSVSAADPLLARNMLVTAARTTRNHNRK